LKRRFLITGLVFFILLELVYSPVFAQFKKPRKPSGPASHIKVDKEKYKHAGVIIGKSFLKTGDKLSILWGVMGPPDKIWAMRGKDDVNQDYVKLDYYSYGLSFDINSITNSIQGILIEENNRIFKLKGVPFGIGQKYKIVTQTWGEPENTAPGILAYWRRGVYIGVDDSGSIVHIFITAPGEFEDEKKEEKDNRIKLDKK